MHYFNPIMKLSDDECEYVENQTDILVIGRLNRSLYKIMTSIMSFNHQKMIEVMRAPPTSIQGIVDLY